MCGWLSDDGGAWERALVPACAGMTGGGAGMDGCGAGMAGEDAGMVEECGDVAGEWSGVGDRGAVRRAVVACGLPPPT